MDFRDHDYAINQHDSPTPAEYTYKMSAKETEDFVKLRISNNYLFTGRRNSSMLAWSSILKHMGLDQKMTYIQASRKWENMKKKYKELKNPPDEQKVLSEIWPYFGLMNDAMEGRLQGDAPILKVMSSNKDMGESLPSSKPTNGKAFTGINSSMDFLMVESVNEVSVSGDENGEKDGHWEFDDIMDESDQERDTIDEQRHVVDKEKQVMERERLVLQRERAVLDRETAALDRDRASLERERAILERERAVLEKERMMVEKERNAVCRERLAVEQEKARLQRLCASTERLKEATEDGAEDKDIPDRKERFLNLLEKLLENV